MTKPRVLITSRLFTFTAESSQAVLRKSLSPILIRLQASLGSRAPCLICGKKKKNPFKYYSFNSFFKHKTQWHLDILCSLVNHQSSRLVGDDLLTNMGEEEKGNKKKVLIDMTPFSFPASTGGRKWHRLPRQMRTWVAFHNSALTTWRSRTDRFLQGQMRLNLKGPSVDFGVNGFGRDLKIKRTQVCVITTDLTSTLYCFFLFFF